MQANDVLFVVKILLGYEEALWPKKLEISHASQIASFRAYLGTILKASIKNINKL